jgi:hypothetical protein
MRDLSRLVLGDPPQAFQQGARFLGATFSQQLAKLVPQVDQLAFAYELHRNDSFRCFRRRSRVSIPQYEN